MPRKPDRFERMVEKEYKKWVYRPQEAGWISIPLKLLRRQHRAHVRMVKNMPRVPYLASDSLLRSEVIETLKRYAK